MGRGGSKRERRMGAREGDGEGDRQGGEGERGREGREGGDREGEGEKGKERGSVAAAVCEFEKLCPLYLI